MITRPDVLSWASEPLSKDIVVSGKITAHLFASTSGTDSDWIVKLIDVYPERGGSESAKRPEDERLSTDDRRRRFARPLPQESGEARADCVRRGNAVCDRFSGERPCVSQ